MMLLLLSLYKWGGRQVHIRSRWFLHEDRRLFKLQEVSLTRFQNSSPAANQTLALYERALKGRHKVRCIHFFSLDILS